MTSEVTSTFKCFDFPKPFKGGKTQAVGDRLLGEKEGTF